MFVHSASFSARRRGGTLSVYGQERVEETVRLCKMNLAVHGLGGSVLQGNSYYSDPFEAVGKFNYVMANPPFNVDGVNKEDLIGVRTVTRQSVKPEYAVSSLPSVNLPGRW